MEEGGSRDIDWEADGGGGDGDGDGGGGRGDEADAEENAVGWVWGRVVVDHRTPVKDFVTLLLTVLENPPDSIVLVCCCWALLLAKRWSIHLIHRPFVLRHRFWPRQSKPAEATFY